MRKMILSGAAVLALAVVLLSASTSMAGRAKASTSLTCSIKSVAISGKKLVAAGSCKYGTLTVPAKNVKWSYSYSSTDIDGAACGSFGHASGSASTASLPEAPTGVGGAPSPAMPGKFSASFTLAASYKGKTVKTSKAFSQTTPTTHVLCGNPPKMTMVPLAAGATPACTWGSNPTYSGGLLKAGASIKCAGFTSCQWHSAQVYMQAGYLVAGSTFTCAGGYVGNVAFQIDYLNAASNAIQCNGSVTRARIYPISTAWGPNQFRLVAFVDMSQNGHLTNNAQASLWKMFITPSGHTNPCPIAH